uniref:Ubiquitin-like domain-containing protein n=1 Tax=Aegilops tauschii TaxID=37682 RepID=R7W0P8_AEGTA
MRELLFHARCVEPPKKRCPSGELERALSEAEAYASKVQVRHNKFVSPHALREHIKNIEKTAANALPDTSEALCPQHPKSDEKRDSIQLWWAGKELAMHKKLSDYIGVNDKTKEGYGILSRRSSGFSNRPRNISRILKKQLLVLYKRLKRPCVHNIQNQVTRVSLDEKLDSIQLWWAGKELAMDKKLSDHICVNDKTKIVIRLSLPMSPYSIEQSRSEQEKVKHFWASRFLISDRLCTISQECCRHPKQGKHNVSYSHGLFISKYLWFCGINSGSGNQRVQVRHNKFVSPRALRERNTAANALQETSEAFSVCNIQNQQRISSAYHSIRSCEQYPDEKCDGIQLRWARKELAMDKKLSCYVGVNDKTKIVVRLNLHMSLYCGPVHC